jgi:hypothetical protein
MRVGGNDESEWIGVSGSGTGSGSVSFTVQPDAGMAGG